MIDVILSQRRSPFHARISARRWTPECDARNMFKRAPNHPGARRREGSFGEAMYLFEWYTVNFPIYGI
jgi:hypothetical protein